MARTGGGRSSHAKSSWPPSWTRIGSFISIPNAGEMREFYQSLHGYVCASRSEGTPNPCLEAAACGLPILTTQVGNMPEFLRDAENGLFVTRNSDDIAAKLRMLRDDADLRERTGRAARAAVEAWVWRRQAPHYAEMFEAVLEGRLKPPAPTVPSLRERVVALWDRLT
jgi:glycosyltransferase involved in cell wall biosynthesis